MNPDFWNEKYQGERYHYGRSANRFLQLMLQGRPPGRLLLPAEGEGRNAVYAAKMGWEVQAFDSSAVARAKALALAEEEGVQIDYQLCDLSDFVPGHKFEAIALIYAHFPPALRQNFHAKLGSWLSPAGEVWIEAFAPGQLEFSSGGPKDEAMLYSPELLEKDFAHWQIRQAERLRYQLDEGPGHQGLAEVTRLRAVI